MKAKDIYEKETNDMEPNDQIGFYEWYQRYVRWLEKQVETNEQGAHPK